MGTVSKITMRYKSFIFTLVLIFLALHAPSDALAATITVSPGESIQTAINNASPGDTVLVQTGTYSGRVTITKDGEAGKPITVKAQGEVIVNGFTLNGADFITIDGFKVDSAIGFGIEVLGKNCVINNNYVHYASKGGIMLRVESYDLAATSDCIISNNRLHRNSQWGINVRGRNHQILNNEVWGTIQRFPGSTRLHYDDADGIRFFGSGHVLRNNYIHDIPFDGELVDDSHTDCFQTYQILPYQEAASNITLDGNKCILPYYAAANAHTNAFMLAQATNLTIKNNLIHTYGGINTGGGGNSNLNILNNTWIGFTDQTQLKNCVVGLECWPGGIGLQNTPNAIIKNNIFYDHLYAPVTVDSVSLTTLVHSNNLMYRSDGQNWPASQLISSTGELWKVDPKFVNNLTNFHLQSTSPAINSGYNLGSLVSNDFEGISRPQGSGYDIGAYEYIGSTTQSTPTPSLTSAPSPTRTPTPSRTPTPTQTPTPSPTPTPIFCAADFNHDHVVTDTEAQQVLGKIGVHCSGCVEDVKPDGVINALDFGVILNSWGICPK